MKSSACKLLDTAVRKSNRIKCFGHSMFPILLHEDVVYFKNVSFEDIHVNDIIIVKTNRTYVTHRVIYIGKNHLITKGDNNQNVDPLTRKENIIGKVYKIKRNEKFLHPDTIYLLQSTRYFDAITKCIQNLNEKKVPYVLLKGLILHLYFSKSHPRRRYLDYDILVRYEDFHTIEKILRALGYSKRDDSISPLQKSLLDKPIEVTFIQDDPNFPIAVDIHFEPVFMMTQIGRLDELYKQANIDEMRKCFFKEKEIIRIHNFSYQILSSSHLIVYLALHFFHHNFIGIHRLELLDAVIRKIPPNNKRVIWTETIQFIHDFQLESFVYGSFITLRKYFQTPLPKNFMSAFSPKRRQKAYVHTYFRSSSVFESWGRLREGKQLFINLFRLSPSPLLLKVRVFLKPIVIYMVLWSIYAVISRAILFKIKTWKKALEVLINQ